MHLFIYTTAQSPRKVTVSTKLKRSYSQLTTVSAMGKAKTRSLVTRESLSLDPCPWS